MKRFVLETKLKILNNIPTEELVFKDFFLQTKDLFLSFFFSLYPFLFEAKTDENVLLMLIEHKNVFNLLESRLIERNLCSFFASNHESLKAIICEGLTKRGFAHIFIEKQPQIDAMKWENLCQTTQDLI